MGTASFTTRSSLARYAFRVFDPTLAVLAIMDSRHGAKDPYVASTPNDAAASKDRRTTNRTVVINNTGVACTSGFEVRTVGGPPIVGAALLVATHG